MYCYDAAQCLFCTAAAFPNVAVTASNSTLRFFEVPEVLRGPLGQYSRNIAESTQEKSWALNKREGALQKNGGWNLESYCSDDC